MVEKVLLLINLLADLPFEDLHFVIDNARQINKLKNAKPKLKHSLTFLRLIISNGHFQNPSVLF